MIAGQIQVRVGFSDALYDFLQSKAIRWGVPVTQVVRNMVIKEAEKEEFPVFPASNLAEQKFKEAQTNLDKFTKIDNMGSFMDSL